MHDDLSYASLVVDAVEDYADDVWMADFIDAIRTGMSITAAMSYADSDLDGDEDEDDFCDCCGGDPDVCFCYEEDDQC